MSLEDDFIRLLLKRHGIVPRWGNNSAVPGGTLWDLIVYPAFRSRSMPGYFQPRLWRWLASLPSLMSQCRAGYAVGEQARPTFSQLHLKRKE